MALIVGAAALVSCANNAPTGSVVGVFKAPFDHTNQIVEATTPLPARSVSTYGVSAHEGRFTLRLPAGTYSISVAGTACEPTIHVQLHRTSRVELECT